MEQSPRKVLLRGYVAREGDQYVAACITLTLAAQADTPEAALSKLFDIIDDYMTEAVTDDRIFADQLLNRRAPASEYAKYYYARIRHLLRSTFDNDHHDDHPTDHMPFKRLLPLHDAA